jgi:dehydrogenase/reductase SDR family protein 1
MSGKVVQTAELSVKYGFTDVDGGRPEGDFSGVEAAKLQREMMSKPLIQYDMDAELPDSSETNNLGISGLFAGAKNYSV